MAKLRDLRAALVVNLKASISDVQIEPYLLDDPTPPTLHILPGETDWHQALEDGLEMRELIVQALVGTAIKEGAQVVLDEFLDSDGDTSVKSAIESDPTLGGLADDLIVVKTKGYQMIKNRPDKPAQLGAEWLVHIYVSGSDE